MLSSIGTTSPAAHRRGPTGVERVPQLDPGLPGPRLASGNGRGMTGVFLEHLTWIEAEEVLTEEAVVVIPLGAAAKEHGPHLQINNDWLIAEHLKHRVVEGADVVVAPTVAYHYFPAFTEYPGSITLSCVTARDLVVDICRSLACYGPRRFYVLNTGVSTIKPLREAADRLSKDGVTLRYTDTGEIVENIVARVGEQEGGTHADEIETSMMLYIAPETVDMEQAQMDFHPAPGGLTRRPDGAGAYSPSGIYGDATLATRDKGEAVVETLVAGILREIEDLRLTPLPEM